LILKSGDYVIDFLFRNLVWTFKRFEPIVSFARSQLGGCRHGAGQREKTPALCDR
jgi:hypothetical protein